MTNPSAALAAHILDRLAEEGLLRRDDVTALLPAFAEGRLSADDWVRHVGRAAPTPDEEPTPADEPR